MRNLLRFAIALVVLMGTLSVSIGSASASPVAPTLTATPDTGLENGQTVTVSGSVLEMSVPVLVEQCTALLFAPDPCGPAVHVTAGTDGEFSTPFVIQGDHCDPAAFLCYIGVFSGDGRQLIAFDIITFDRHAAEPDVVIRRRSDGHLLFDNVEGSGSSVYTHHIAAGGQWTFATLVQNDGTTAGDIEVTAPSVAAPFGVQYFVGYYDVTAFVTGSGLTLTNVPAGGEVPIAVRFTAAAGAPSGATADVTLTAASHAITTVVDDVHIGVRVG